MILLVFLLLLAALALIGIVATFVALPNDGYRRVPTDWSRLP